MDNGGEDDQASGWMQVKKKHRSNLKSSLNGWVGGISSKQTSRYPKNRVSSVQETGTRISESLSAKTSKYNPTVQSSTTSANRTSISLEKGSVVHYLDKCVVSESNKKDLEGENSLKSKLQFVLDPESKQNDGVLPKIKWGDLDEGTLLHYGKPYVSGVNSGVGNSNLVSVSCGSDGELLPNIPADSEKNECEEPINKDKVDTNSNSPTLSARVRCVEEPSQEVHEASSEDVKEQITAEKIVNESPTVSGIGVEHAQLRLENTLESSRDIHVHRINDEVATENADIVLSNSVSSDIICVVPLVSESSDTQISESEPTLPSSGSVKESYDQQHNPKAENIMDCAVATSSDATGESKERFRERLWCFLFENLNRAVDEIYLLCELECDLDQMKEASLVLDEAASDFRELSSRVENFEELKSSSTHEADETSLLMQSDHRRPHALSWEVRRMTTSPRRAEILSSSLEAFRKIQEERNRERTKCAESQEYDGHNCIVKLGLDKFPSKGALVDDSKDMKAKAKKLVGVSDISQGSSKGRKTTDLAKPGSVAFKLSQKEGLAASVDVKEKRELGEPASVADKQILEKNKMLPKRTADKNVKSADSSRRQVSFPERDREKRNSFSTNSMDAWKERRNWEDILSSPSRVSSRFSYSPGMSRRSSDRVRVLHDKLMSPEKKKKSSLDLKKEAEEKHARATRIRAQLESERAQKLQRTSEKLNRVNEWQIVRSNKLRESMFARHQRSESRHEAYIAQVVRRAGDESSKVNEVRFITSLNEESKKHILRKKLQDSETRRAEKLQVIRTKQREDMAREEAVLERRRLLEAEKLQRLAETQKRKEEAQMRREEERKASSAAREARAMEQMRRKEIRAKAQQEEAELLAQKLAEKLRESEQRRKFYLEQIRERASMDFRDQSSPLLRRVAVKEGPGPGRSASNPEDSTGNDSGCIASDTLPSEALQQSLKRRIKKIRQRLMSLKHDFPEPLVGQENSSLGYRTALGTARAKIGRWLQDLQKLRQARKDGAANFGLITSEMIKFLEGKDAELQASRQAGLLDFIASALPASQTSKPEACQVTLYLLRLLKVVLVMPSNRCYFLVQNLLPPIIPMLAAALENYIKMAASASIPSSTNSLVTKASTGNLELISEIVDGFLWSISAIIGHVSCNVYQLQMLDGLVELVITYQIIHRLRDLFALYDRPQVEGSPFPSTILLGIDFLTVLTSKFRESPSINWERFSSDVMQENALSMENLPEHEDLKSDPCSSGLDAKPLYSVTGSLITHLPDVPEDRPLDISGNQGTAGSNLMCNNSRESELIASKCQSLDGVSTEGQLELSVTQKARNKSLSSGEGQNNKTASYSKQPAKILLSAMLETGLVCLPSMLTAVLLQANNRLSAEQSSFVLPSNFEEVATGILKVLNNLALIDVTFIQKMLSRPDLKMEFFHLMSFILAHCTSNWGTASDKIGSLLLESLSLLSYFALFHPENQAVLRWGNSPTILHKVCDLPFVFFSDPDLMPVLAGTLVAVSYGSEQNKAVIQQELSIEMLLPLLRSCKNATPMDDNTGESNQNQNQIGLERKSQGDASQRSHRNYLKSMRLVSQRNNRVKGKNSRDNKVVKLNEEMQLGTSQSTTLIHRFPVRFIEKAEDFFAREANISSDELA